MLAQSPRAGARRARRDAREADPAALGRDGARFGAIFCAWRSGVISTTFQASFSRFIARMTTAEVSTSHHLRPCTAERGKAWWLWCHDSPNDGSASQKTLVE